MVLPGKSAVQKAKERLRRGVNRVLALHPEWPLALALVLGGALNIKTGLRYNLVSFGQIGPLSDLGQSLSVLGSSTQAILGACQVLVGLGLLRRLATAWAFAVLLLAVTVGVNLVQGYQGASLIFSSLMLLALLILRRYFTRHTTTANYIFSFMGILAILAYGTFGTYMLGDGFHPKIHANTSRELQARGIPFVQIISTASTPAHLSKDQVVRGNAGDDQVLTEAGIDSAILVIAAREDDGENAFISLVAKDLNPNVRVLAVASARGSIRRLKLARAEIVFAPSVVGGRMLANIVEGKEIPQEFKDLLEGKHKKT